MAVLSIRYLPPVPRVAFELSLLVSLLVSVYMCSTTYYYYYYYWRRLITNPKRILGTARDTL